MLLKNVAVSLFLLGATTARFHILPRGLDVLQSLVAKAGSAADPAQDPVPYCELDDSGAAPTPTPAASPQPCPGCKTVDGVLVGSDAELSLSPEDNILPDGGVDTGAPLIPRAGVPIPLLPQGKRPTPARQQVFIRELRDAPAALDVGIDPPDAQIKGANPWKSKSGIPIGATSNWYPFTDKPGIWKMYGMTGCTAIFIVSEKGFWAGHLWESSKSVNGGSAFLKRQREDQKGLPERPDNPDFAEVAVDIFTQPVTPAGMHWISLPTLKANFGDPFATPPDIYILTKAVSVQQPNTQLYASKIKLLTDMLQSQLSPRKMTVQTYVGVDFGPGQTKVPLDLNGLSIIQYTPFQGYDGDCDQMAAVKIWAEDYLKEVVDKTWKYVPPANKRLARRANACVLPGSTVTTTNATTTPGPTKPPSPVTSVPCLVYEDKDTIGAKCECSNGATISTVPPSGTNTGLTYNACPWPTLPPQALTTPAPPPPTTQTLQYPYTFTDPYGKVEECQSSSVGFAGGVHYTVCEGSSAVLYEKPTNSMEVGQSSVLVGSSLTGPALMSTLSSVLKTMCPTPTSPGALTSCETGVVVLGQATWLNKESNPEPGDLTISIPNANYNSTDYRDLFISLLASAANASASGTNCQKKDWTIPPVLEPRCGQGCGPAPKVMKGSDTFCNMASFFDNQFYDGVKEQATQWFTAEFGFELGSMGEYSCDDTIGLIGDVLLAVLPEFDWAIEAGIELAGAACALNDTLSPLINSKSKGPKPRKARSLEIDNGK